MRQHIDTMHISGKVVVQTISENKPIAGCNVEYVTDDEGFNWPIVSTKSSRKRSWITHTEVAHEYPEFIDKLADILFDDVYNDKSKAFARSILAFLADHDFVTWRQFDSIIRVYKSRDEYYDALKNGTRVTKYKDTINFQRDSVSFSVKVGVLDELDIALGRIPMTDKDMDRLHDLIFGHMPWFEEEEEGLELHYDNTGGRFFGLPTI